MSNPLDKLTTVIAGLMGKEPSDPDVLEAVVEVVMAIRVPSDEMIQAGFDRSEATYLSDVEVSWKAMIDALLTEGG